MSLQRVCLIPKLSGLGGMVSFEGRLAKGLAEHGIEASFALSDRPYQAVLVVGGSRDLAGLWRLHRQGIRIVQRLDGMNWLHRKRRTGLRHYLRAEYGNLILSTIRSRLADQIVYQSQFSKRWWERVHGPTRVPSQVVYNGVDLEQFEPNGIAQCPVDCFRLLMVEGTLAGGYEVGLETGVKLLHLLNDPDSSPGKAVELVVAGKASAAVREHWAKQAGKTLKFIGQVPLEKIPELDCSAHLLYSADLNAACPNSVIEGLACGLPVVAFDTGALPELVTGNAGRIAPYGGNPWNLDPPDVPALARQAREILLNQELFRPAARLRAEQVFSLDQMVEGYIKALSGA